MQCIVGYIWGESWISFVFSAKSIPQCIACKSSGDVKASDVYCSSLVVKRVSFVYLQVASGQAPCSKKVKISLVNVEYVRRKQIIQETLKELNNFTIKILPSGLPHTIQICHSTHNETNGMNGNGSDSDSNRECLELSAPAGSIVKGLYLKAFDESGRSLSVTELRNAEPRIQTSWSGEVTWYHKSFNVGLLQRGEGTRCMCTPFAPL